MVGIGGEKEEEMVGEEGQWKACRRHLGWLTVVKVGGGGRMEMMCVREIRYDRVGCMGVYGV